MLCYYLLKNAGFDVKNSNFTTKHELKQTRPLAYLHYEVNFLPHFLSRLTIFHKI